MNVIPAILPHSYEHLVEKLERIDNLATLVQIDLCDGIFGLEKTWMPVFGDTLPIHTGMKYQFDVMVSDWRPVINALVMLSPLPQSIVMHVDSCTDEDLDELISIVSSARVSLGVAVANDVELSVLFNAIRKVRPMFPRTFVQVMGIAQVGEQGQTFDERCLSRITAIAQEFGDVEIQVDGAMRPETAILVKNVGVDTIVVGSYILRHDDPGQAIETLSIIGQSKEDGE